MMVKIKICGLTRMTDIQTVNECQPDYAGFVFAESRRRVTPAIAQTLIEKLSPSVKKVGVFVNEHIEKVMEIAQACDLDIIQLHGDETPYYCSLIDRPVWKALRVKNAETLQFMNQYKVDAILLDSYTSGQQGGTGKAFDWSYMKYAGKNHKLVLGGGINASNVRTAISLSRPYCVDISSGVETNGVKDGYKIKEFIETVRMEDRSYA